MEGFNKFIDSNLLLDLPVVRRKFTCINLMEQQKIILDWALISYNWMEIWSRLRQYVLNKTSIRSLVIKNKISDWCLKPFQSFDAWEELERFKEVIRVARGL